MNLKDAEKKTGMAAANLRRALIAGKLAGTKTATGWEVEPTELNRYDKTITRGRSRQTLREVIKIVCTRDEAAKMRLKAKSDPRGFSAWARTRLLR